MSVLSRRAFVIAGGAAGLIAAGGGTLYELIQNGVLPGRYRLDAFLGYCDVADPHLTFGHPGPEFSGTFYSHYRKRQVGYIIAYPPGHVPGALLPLIVGLHGEGGTHLDTVFGPSPAHTLAVKVGGKLLPPMAVVTVDGGRGYWNPHPDDDPFGMVVDELIPMCRERGLGRPKQGIATVGVSMGGYGAILLAEKRPDLIRAVAAISPAIWTSYSQARHVNPDAYASVAAFAAADVVTHTAALNRVPIRVAIGDTDPFLPGVQALQPHLPPHAVVVISKGCHSGPFFTQQWPPSLTFVGKHLAKIS